MSDGVVSNVKKLVINNVTPKICFAYAYNFKS